jgi:hypothetical protein
LEGLDLFFTPHHEIINRKLDRILELLEAAPGQSNPATRITLALPSITRNGALVANYELANDTVATISIVTTDAAGATVPAPASDVFSVTSSAPTSLTAAIGKDANGNPAVVLTPLVQVSEGLSITITDSAGLTSDAQGIDIVQDLAPKAIGLNLTTASVTAQTVPTAPGP